VSREWGHQRRGIGAWPELQSSVPDGRSGIATCERQVVRFTRDFENQRIPWRPRARCVWAKPPGIYEPRDPSQSVLYHLGPDHFETFRAQPASRRDGEGLPGLSTRVSGSISKILCYGLRRRYLVGRISTHRPDAGRLRANTEVGMFRAVVAALARLRAANPDRVRSDPRVDCARDVKVRLQKGVRPQRDTRPVTTYQPC
jgi:hypothetical protein